MFHFRNFIFEITRFDNPSFWIELQSSVHSKAIWVVKFSRHTAGLDTIFIQITMDAPQGSQGCQKIAIFLQLNLLSSCAKIDRHKMPVL